MARRDDGSRVRSNDEASSSPQAQESAVAQPLGSRLRRDSPNDTRGAGDQRVLHGIPHVRQCFNWDCGLACVLMIVKGLGVTSDFRTLRELCPTTSIWTVDLAFLLRKFGAEVTFCTVTLGANPDFEEERFYKDHMVEDSRRIEQLFRDASENGIPIQRRSLDLEEMRQYVVSGNYLIIVLVDKKRFNRHWAYGDDPYASYGGETAESYTGHYVVVSGFDPESGNFMVQDPASGVPVLEISEAALEASRKCFGTDEDLLIVAAGALDPGCIEAALRAHRQAVAGGGGEDG